MPEDNKLTEVSTSELETVANKICEAKSSDEVKDLTNAFLLAHMKKDALRSAALSDLKDDLIAQLKKRVTAKSDEISNRDLIDFINVVSNQEDKAKDNVVNQSTKSTVLINDNSININNNGIPLTQESRERVLEALKYFMENGYPDVVDAEVINLDKGE